MSGSSWRAATVVQVGVPLYFGVFTRFGNAAGAVVGIVAALATLGFKRAMARRVPWAWGLSAGMIALVVNAVVYVAVGYAVQQSASERRRVADLFDSLDFG